MHEPRISIVIAFRDEEESLRVLLPEIEKAMVPTEAEYEVLLVDDCSSDRGPEFVRQFAQSAPQFRLIRLAERGGQTGCYRAAFPEARGSHIVRMDADLQDDPADLPSFLPYVDRGFDLVMGLRECRKHSRTLRLASGIYDLMIMLLFNSPLHSNSGSYVCFRRELVQDLPWWKNDHRYIPLIAMRRGDVSRVAETIVRHRERRFGVSKYSPWRKLVLGFPEVIRFLIRLRRGAYDLESKASRRRG